MSRTQSDMTLDDWAQQRKAAHAAVDELFDQMLKIARMVDQIAEERDDALRLVVKLRGPAK